MRALTLSLVLLLALGGCREPLGTPDYTGYEPVLATGDAATPAPLPGTDRFLPGQKRLNLGIFYEGGFSEIIALGPEGPCNEDPHSRPLRCYFIFETEAEELQYTQDTTSDRVEGLLADRFTLTGTPFWGGGIIWDEPEDLSRWTTLAVALKSSDASFSNVTISMQWGAEVVLGDGVPASDYGYTNDGAWHVLRIPLADFEGLDRGNVRAPFILGGTGNTAGDQLLVDEVYLTRD